MSIIKLSLKLIAESLSNYDAQLIETEKKDFSFSGVQILTSPTDDLNTDTLYICTPRVLPKIKKTLFEKHCFIFKARPSQLKCDHALNGIMLRDDSNINEVVNHLIALFSDFYEFEYSIREAALSRRGYEPFFKIASEALPECLVVITDSAYNIVCATKTSVPSCEYLGSLLQRGYYSREDLDLMAAYGYYDDERKYYSPILYEKEKTICGLPFLVKSYRRNDAAFSFIGCYFLNDYATEREIALFTCITKEIDTYYKVNGAYEVGMLGKTQQLLDDLIRPKQDTPEYFRDRCTQLRIPYQGMYRVSVIQSENMSMIKVSQIANQLNAHCQVPNYGVFQYSNVIVIIFRDWTYAKVSTKATIADDWELLLATLKQNRSYIGVSMLFSDITKFSVAYQQAETAVNLGRKRNNDKNSFFFSSYCLEDMLWHYDSVMPLQETYTKYLEQLLDDNNDSCSNIKLLYHYLCCERNISMTAKCVHMHRNSVIYRIQKIKDLLAVDLDDPDVRLRLMIAFKILEMTGKFPQRDKFCEYEL